MQSRLERVRGEQGVSQARPKNRYHRYPLRQSVKQPVQSNLETVRGEQGGEPKLHSALNTIGAHLAKA